MQMPICTRKYENFSTFQTTEEVQTNPGNKVAVLMLTGMLIF